MKEALSYRNQSIDLRSKSMDRFLYDIDLRHEWVKQNRYKLKKQSRHKKSLSLFFNVAIEEKLRQKNVLFFTINFFLFLFLVRV